MKNTIQLSRLRSRLINGVDAGVLAVNEMGYFYPIPVSKRDHLCAVKILYRIILAVHDLEQDEGVSITVEDRFGLPMWHIEDT